MCLETLHTHKPSGIAKCPPISQALFHEFEFNMRNFYIVASSVVIIAASNSASALALAAAAAI